MAIQIENNEILESFQVTNDKKKFELKIKSTSMKVYFTGQVSAEQTVTEQLMTLSTDYTITGGKTINWINPNTGKIDVAYVPIDDPNGGKPTPPEVSVTLTASSDGQTSFELETAPSQEEGVEKPRILRGESLQLKVETIEYTIGGSTITWLDYSDRTMKSGDTLKVIYTPEGSEEGGGGDDYDPAYFDDEVLAELMIERSGAEGEDAEQSWKDISNGLVEWMEEEGIRPAETDPENIAKTVQDQFAAYILPYLSISGTEIVFNPPPIIPPTI